MSEAGGAVCIRGGWTVTDASPKRAAAVVSRQTEGVSVSAVRKSAKNSVSAGASPIESAASLIESAAGAGMLSAIPANAVLSGALAVGAAAGTVVTLCASESIIRRRCV